jgi:Lar family restriction alleviation protein
MSNAVMLEHCPFCGSNPRFSMFELDSGVIAGFQVRCPSCGAAAKGSENKQEALSAWNRRVDGAAS